MSTTETQTPSGVTTRLNSDGTVNPKYVDVLDEDKSIAGQKFVCVSFLSPEKILEEKNTFFFKQFLKQWDMSKSLQKYTQFLNFISYKHNVNFDELSKDLEEFVKSERDNLFTTTVEDEFKTFVDNNEEKMQADFDESHSFQTSTRGIKIRGAFPTQGEAEVRAKLLRESDPNHNVYVGPVGLWMPFHPESYKTGRVEYLEDELNQLMHEKTKNESKAKEDFDSRVKDAKKKAMEDNKEKALASGNKLTQTIDEAGNLVSVKDVTTFDNKLGDSVTAADIRKELFNDENVVTDKNTDHGLSALTDSLENTVISTSEDKEDTTEGAKDE
jgi:hypothetical protein